jgi:hypothetical protein
MSRAGESNACKEREQTDISDGFRHRITSFSLVDDDNIVTRENDLVESQAGLRRARRDHTLGKVTESCI